MRKNIPPSSLARDGRFNRIDTERRLSDRRDAFVIGHVDPGADDVGERARRRMHGAQETSRCASPVGPGAAARTWG